MFNLTRKNKFIPFDLAIQLVTINADDSLSDVDKVIKLGKCLWADFDSNVEAIDQRQQELADKMEQIYSVLEKDDPTKKPANANRTGRLYSFSEDADAIFASFMQIGINLHNEIGRLSWEDFYSTLFNLPKNCAFMERIKIRSMNPADYPQEEQAKIMQAQAAVALKPTKADAEHADDVLKDIFDSW